MFFPSAVYLDDDLFRAELDVRHLDGFARAYSSAVMTQSISEFFVIQFLSDRYPEPFSSRRNRRHDLCKFSRNITDDFQPRLGLQRRLLTRRLIDNRDENRRAEQTSRTDGGRQRIQVGTVRKRRRAITVDVCSISTQSEGAPGHNNLADIHGSLTGTYFMAFCPSGEYGFFAGPDGCRNGASVQARAFRGAFVPRRDKTIGRTQLTAARALGDEAIFSSSAFCDA